MTSTNIGYKTTYYMKRVIILIAAALTFAACNKDEYLAICFANAYDQTVILSTVVNEDWTIKKDKIFTTTLCQAHGMDTHLDVPALWKSHFYDKYDTITVYTEDKTTVLESWTKGDNKPGNPFDIANWSNKEKVESGIEGGLKEGVQYIFMVSAYTKTSFNLTYVFCPRE